MPSPPSRSAATSRPGADTVATVNVSAAPKDVSQPQVVDSSLRYWAFISYSHRDRKWGDWLHRAIETYRVPKALVGNGIPARVFPVFRDREELAGAVDLTARIETALAESRNLIVICSPRSAASRWVNEEIRRFAHSGPADRIFAFIIDGEPNAAADEAEANW